jgi:hypothetical protein
MGGNHMSAITKTDAGLNLARDGDSGANNSKITYVAFGTGTTAPTNADTKLVAEVFRKKVTTYVNGSTGEILVSMYLSPGESVGTDIEEVGFFGGNTATSAKNSGVLIGRGLWVHNPKTNLESITFALDKIYS